MEFNELLRLWNNLLWECGFLLTGIEKQAPQDDRLPQRSHSGTRGGCLKGHSVAIEEIPIRIYTLLIAKAPHSSTKVNWNEWLFLDARFALCSQLPSTFLWLSVLHKLQITHLSYIEPQPQNEYISELEFLCRYAVKCQVLASLLVLLEQLQLFYPTSRVRVRFLERLEQPKLSEQQDSWYL